MYNEASKTKKFRIQVGSYYRGDFFVENKPGTFEQFNGGHDLIDFLILWS